MRYLDLIVEGKVLALPISYSVDGAVINVIQNPTTSQVVAMIDRTKDRDDGSFYLRGLMINGKTLLIWDGWKATHDDVRAYFYPKIEYWQSEYTSFFISEKGGEVERQGDYDVHSNRYYQNAMKALDSTDLAEAYLTTIGRRVGSLPETFTEVFINPTPSEIRDMKAVMNRESVKALLRSNNDVIMWAGHTVHHGDVMRHFTIKDVERLMFVPDKILFYAHIDDDQRNARIADRIANHRVLKRWRFSHITDQEGNDYPLEERRPFL